MKNLPQPVVPMLEFAQALRRSEFAIAPDQTIGFISAVELLGPGTILDIHKAGLALFAIPPERRAEYDAVFRAIFMGLSAAAPPIGAEDDEFEVHEPSGDAGEAEGDEDDREIGEEASAADRLGYRPLSPGDETRALADFARRAPQRLPKRASYRRRPTKAGDRLDIRRTLRQAARYEGEVLRLCQSSRKQRQRKLLLLIDVSGSMEEQTESALRLAHAVVQIAERAEVFTLGTRLTRLTPALQPSDRAQALSRAAALVADIDGGTRLGAALDAFLRIPRFVGFARGAAVVVLSDGLERDAPDMLIAATKKLERLAWRLDWLTPLANDPAYRPETQAMAHIAQHVAHLGDGSNLAAVADHILNLSRPE